LIWGNSYGAIRIETICERAGVKKGTFYHFFDSKADLVLAAMNAWWEERSLILKDCFGPEVPPLERISRYINSVADGQIQWHAQNGHVRGCPLFTLGSEISTQDGQILSRIRELLSLVINLFEQAIREAQAEGEIDGNKPEQKTRLLWAFYEGTLTRARIENNPDLIRNLTVDALELIGARPAVLA